MIPTAKLAKKRYLIALVSITLCTTLAAKFSAVIVFNKRFAAEWTDTLPKVGGVSECASASLRTKPCRMGFVYKPDATVKAISVAVFLPGAPIVPLVGIKAINGAKFCVSDFRLKCYAATMARYRSKPCVMNSLVLGGAENLKVFRPVVVLNAVPVVNILRPEQLPPKVCLHDQSVLGFVVVPNSDPYVTSALNLSTFPPRHFRRLAGASAIRGGAGVTAEFLQGKSRWWMNMKRSTTIQAGLSSNHATIKPQFAMNVKPFMTVL